MDNSNKKIGFSQEVCVALNESIPVHHRVGPMNKSYSYHRGSDIIRQMNKVFGHAWSSSAVKDFEIHDQIVVLVAVNVIDPNAGMITHQGFGSSQIARKKGTNEIIDIGNAYKTAYTNGLKKACEQFGVGLGLSEEEDSPAKVPTAGNYTAPKKTNYVPNYNPQASRQATAASPVVPAKQPFVNRQAVSTAPQSPIPVPTATDGMITDMQKSAINSIVKTKKLDASELIKNSLGGSTKTTVESLTKAEAVKVIRFATSTTPKG